MIRTVLQLLLAVALSGCALFSGPAKFDPIETVSYIELWQWGARLGEGCGDRVREHAALSGMKVAVERLALLTRHGPDEDSRAVFAAAERVVADVRAGGSRMFCEEAALNVREAAERALKAVGRRPR